MNYQEVYQLILKDPRYQHALDWGKPRPGHPEGTVRTYIEELEKNLSRLQAKLSESDIWKLRILIHTHDTFKGDAVKGGAITDPQSHASLARTFLAEFCDDEELLTIVQFHDEPFALWRQAKYKGSCSTRRWQALLQSIQNWELFLAFLIIDNCTKGKSREPLKWFFQQLPVGQLFQYSVDDLIESADIHRANGCCLLGNRPKLVDIGETWNFNTIT